MNNGIQKLTSAGKVVWSMMEDLGLDKSQDAALYEGIFIRWVAHANLLMGAPVNFETKVFAATVTDGQVKKPCGYVKLELARIGWDCAQIPYFAPIIPDRGHRAHPNTSTWGSWHCRCPNFNPHFYNRNYVIQEAVHYFNFSNNCEGQLFRMNYTAYLRDENDFPLVDETYYEALTAYCRWKYIVQQTTQPYSKSYSIGQEAQAKADWEQFARKAYGKSMMQSLSDDMVEQMLAKFNDPMRVSSNPYARNIDNQNLNHNHNGLLSRPTAL